MIWEQVLCFMFFSKVTEVELSFVLVKLEKADWRAWDSCLSIDSRHSRQGKKCEEMQRGKKEGGTHKEQ